MNIKALRADKIYEKMKNAPIDKREDIYRYDMMQPFQGKWDCYHIPLKAAQPGGYDIIMASQMLGFLSPKAIDESQTDNILAISDDNLWSKCEESIRRSLERFEKAGVELRCQDYLFTIMLAEPTSPYIVLSKGYCGDGGIPGYITGYLVPSEETIRRLPIALAHETNHNMRWQHLTWRNDITLGEMIVSEGVAEVFATTMHGEEWAGPWVTETDMDTLNNYIKPLLKDALGVQGLDEMNAYLYGDEIAKLRGVEPVGMPYCAGYACGYHLVKYYLHKTGKSIEEATILPADLILSECEEFWNEATEWDIRNE